uniref:EMAP like 1 n=1 Tax=Haplochromis burtoni TaxID=8153 RepID=A0A3Q2W6P7_HAPBU
MSDCEGLPMDDSASAASSMEVTDRIASLEQRVQMQEDEIQLLKSALADVVRRLNVSEEQQAMGARRGPTKARPMIATLPLRPTVNNGTVLPKKGSGTLPSPSGSGSRKDTSAPANKTTVRRANSNEQMGTLNRKDSGDSKGNRTRAGSTGSNSSGKRSDSKQRDPVFNAGKKRLLYGCLALMTMCFQAMIQLIESHYIKDAQWFSVSVGGQCIFLEILLKYRIMYSLFCLSLKGSSARDALNCFLYPDDH